MATSRLWQTAHFTIEANGAFVGMRLHCQLHVIALITDVEGGTSDRFRWYA